MKQKREKKPLNKGAMTVALVFLVLLISVLTIIYRNMKGSGSDVDTFRNSILALMENVIEYDVKDEYVIITFPDNDELITKNGKIRDSIGRRYNEFKEGHVIKYKDGTYAFKLTNGSFCAVKDYNDTGVEIDIYEPCSNYDVTYRENYE